MIYRKTEAIQILFRDGQDRTEELKRKESHPLKSLVVYSYAARLLTLGHKQARYYIIRFDLIFIISDRPLGRTLTDVCGLFPTSQQYRVHTKKKDYSQARL
jgi:hypothetical protein